jgi:hypothetical protein
VKVSKPVLILCIVLLLIAGYVHFFTGKKKPKGPVPPAPPTQAQTQPAKPQAGQPQPQPAAPPAPPAPAAQQQQAQQTPGKPEAAVPAVKPQFDKLAVSWSSDPFMLPAIKGKKGREEGTAVRLAAILERGGDRVAVIDRDVVKKGDMIGNEKVVEIGRDRVVLARGAVRRTLTLADPDAVTTEEALTTKPKATERAK